MKWLPGSLRWQTLLVVLVALVLSQAAALWLLHEYVAQPRAALGLGQFVSHLKTISAALQTMDPEQQLEFVARIAEKEGIRIVPSRGRDRVLPAPELPGVQMFRERIRDVFGPDADVYVRAPEAAADAQPRAAQRPPPLLVRLPAGERDFWVAVPRARIERDATPAWVIWGFAGIAIAFLATFMIVWRLSRPLAELSAAAGRLGKGGDPPPVSETGPSEIRAVARAFNQMKEDLKRGERDRATFLAGVSHDLRTPLSRLRLEVEMLEGKVEPATRRAMVDDVDDMNAIIDQFIDFTRSEAAEPLSPVDLGELARACADRATRAGSAVRCEIAEVPALMLRPLALQRLVDNLLGNAARHGGGEVVLRVAPAGDRVTLAVLDRGPGIPADLVERLKQPFTRRDAARTGTSGAGLGLAIADRVATLHGGHLDLLARDGGGLEARLTLPIPA
jgi:two-component system osmolarity sensor histidine kinase EnvZ